MDPQCDKRGLIDYYTPQKIIFEFKVTLCHQVELSDKWQKVTLIEGVKHIK